MTRDLFALAFEEFARWPLETYKANYVERLPYRLWSTAIITNPDIQRQDGFAQLDDVISTPVNSLWRNPEVYPYLNYLNITQNPALGPPVAALNVQCGLRDLTRQLPVFGSIFRIRHPSARAFRISSGAIELLSGISTAQSLDDPFPLIYRPYPNLFSDIEGRYYRGDSSTLSLTSLAQLTERAIQIISRYCPDLAAGITARISTIAFMPRQPAAARSFSLRNFYIGGIFVSLGSVIMLAEQIIHEYYHQQIWPWWLVDRPRDLPPDGNLVRSPVTGKERPMPVMIQAALIYASVSDFYRFVLNSGEAAMYPQHEIEEAQARSLQIDSGYRVLLDSLMFMLINCPETRRLIEFIDCHSQSH